MLADNLSAYNRMAGRDHKGDKDWIKRVDLVVNLKEERINVKCATVRDLLLTFEENHQNEMNRSQVIEICNKIIAAMFDILESYEE